MSFYRHPHPFRYYPHPLAGSPHQQTTPLTTNVINITATAQNNPQGSGLAFISFLSDYAGSWQDIGSDNNGSDGWSYTWDVSGLADKTFSPYIFAFDRAGNY